MPVSLKESLYEQRGLPRNEQVVMGRAELLASADRELVEAVLVRGQTAESIARLTGTPARTVRSRVRKLTRQLTSARFLAAARSLAYLSGDDARVALYAFCRGESQRRLCKRFNMTCHQLRRRLDQVRAKVQTINELTHRPSRSTD